MGNFSTVNILFIRFRTNKFYFIQMSYDKISAITEPFT